jgi:phosphatidylglycerophosphatase A
MSRLALFLASVAYSGYFPVVPGTVGSAAGLVVYAGLRATGAPWLEPVAIVALFLAGTWAAGSAERQLGRSDPGQVVIDEVVGMLVTLAWLPVGPAGALIGFVLFRLFDIVKPWPAGRFERLPGGLGIMSDDVMAGVYANVVLRLIGVAVPAWIY